MAASTSFQVTSESSSLDTSIFRGNTQLRDRLADTISGRDWVLKTLDPALPISAVMMPDGGIVPRALQVYERTICINAGALGYSTNWDVDLLLHANPWIYGAYLATDGTTPTFGSVMNTQLAATSALIRDFLTSHAEEVRVVGGSMTVEVQAPLLNKGGLITAAQYPLLAKDGAYGTNTTYITSRGSRLWFDPPKAYDVLVAMPGAYQGPAEDGCYIPFKVEDPEWAKVNDTRVFINTADCTTMYGAGGSSFTNPSAQLVATSAADWPFGIPGASQAAYVYDIPSSMKHVCHVAVRGVHALANVTAHYRLVVEVKASPNTSFAPSLRVPPEYDPLALAMYRKICHKLPQAYPADWNADWRKILDVVAEIASTMAPPLAPAIGLARRGAELAGAAIEKAVRNRKVRSKDLATQLQPSKGRRNRRKANAKNKPSK